MSTNINRRQWLKSAAFVTAGMAIAPKTFAESIFPDYDPGDDTIWLDQNENPYGISKMAKKAIAEAAETGHRYPDVRVDELRKLIAEKEDVPEDYIEFGAGSTELFSLLCLLNAADGKKVLLSEGAYTGFENYVKRINGKLNYAPMADGWKHDLDQMERQLNGNTSLTYLCNPNNPSGTIVDWQHEKDFCETIAKKCLVLIDEAYHELVDDSSYRSMMPLAREGQNVVILRTFSKIFGLAGMRCGYAIAKPDVLKELRRIKTNFAPVGQATLAAAIASYKDEDFFAFSKAKNIEAKEMFYKMMEKHGRTYIKSHTNFSPFIVDEDAAEFIKPFRKNNIRLRPYTFDGKQWCRVSMGTIEEMKKLSTAIDKLL